MGCTVPVLGLSVLAVAVLALGQDTLLQDTEPVKARFPGCCTANWTVVSVTMDYKLREAERRWTRRLEDRLKIQNQSASIFHMEKLLHHINEELQISKENEQRQTETIKHLRQQVTKQQHELHHTRNSVERLRKNVDGLSSLVEQLLTSQVERTPLPPTPNPPDNSISTTPVPFRPLFPIDCQDVYLNGGMKYPGIYYIMIQPYLSPQPFKVCCKMTNSSGWTLIQRREDGAEDFYRTWEEYKNGFGSLEGEFWLGNDHLYELTNQGDYKLRIDMKDWEGKRFWAEYDHFRISNEAGKYRLHVHGYHGNAGDSLTSHWENHDNQPFSTKDRDNDERFYDNCAEHYHGAWWFKSCFESHLNGVYYHKGSHSNYFVRNGIQWNSIHLHSSLQFVAMMLKPNDGLTDETDLPNGIS